MICGKSRSSWLDRLRIAKGFADNDSVTNLEQFLQNPNLPANEIPDPKSHSVSISDASQNEDKQLFNIMSDVLNELFNFGDKFSNSTKFKKSARKQTNPRICALSDSGSHDDNNAAPGKVILLRSDNSSSGVEGVKVLNKWETEGEGVARDGSLVGFSRTELTVIDTSYEWWKFEKFLYRKKNLWKVRDKKGKSEFVVSKKKRNMAGATAMENDQHGGKKWKVDKKERSGEQFGSPLNEAYHQIKTSEVHDKCPNKVVGSLKKKQPPYLNVENGTSSVILIRSIDTSKKNKTSTSKSCLKPKQKKS